MIIGYTSWRDLKDAQDQEDKMVKLIRNIASIVSAAFMIGLIMHGCIDSADATARKDRKPDPVDIAHYNDKPMAFRKSTPTQDQMDHLHALLRVLEVRKADGTVLDGSE